MEERPFHGLFGKICLSVPFHEQDSTTTSADRLVIENRGENQVLPFAFAEK